MGALVFADLRRAGLAAAKHAAAQIVEVVVDRTHETVVDKMHVEPGQHTSGRGGEVLGHAGSAASRFAAQYTGAVIGPLAGRCKNRPIPRQPRGCD